MMDHNQIQILFEGYPKVLVFNVADISDLYISITTIPTKIFNRQNELIHSFEGRINCEIKLKTQDGLKYGGCVTDKTRNMLTHWLNIMQLDYPEILEKIKFGIISEGKL